ncbi:hypothetical protein GALMADRAFT_147576 [Galerina marginata CBS 339.88]|uniref:G-protein coupled receptors family 1 profile domain-containing protein n=1 Tax=Galerina marginata (strain CBS 339.88) TaxID=685588 RepID=A0A067SGW4_GALM3|nr:hypothetical protein GALMADRAFT_147576 [Galerina marginata CBS 339.88]
MAKASFPIDAAQVVGLFMESVFYGCIRVLLWLDGWFKPLNRVNKKMVFAALLMLVFASMDVAFHLRHNLEAFVYFDGDPIVEFDKTSNWINVMKMGCYVAQTFVGDTILIYRCWIVYSRNWLVVALPILLWLGTTVCGAMTIYVEATLDPSPGKLLDSATLVPFITSMLCLTLATNTITTSLIVHRIWKVRNSLKHRQIVVSETRLTGVVVVLIESGLMYTLSIIILFGLYMASNNGQYGVSNAVVQIIGITFNLIILSVDRGDATVPTSQPTLSRISQQESQGAHPLHKISIHTSVSRYQDPSTPIKSESDGETPPGRHDWKSYQ